MRKLLIVLVVLLVIVGGAVAFALSNLNSYLNENREWLQAEVEKALGRDVEFGEIGVSLFGGFGARVANLRIGDDPSFSKEDFVRADEAQVAVRLWPALFGDYQVSKVILRDPWLQVIREERGFNFETIGAAGEGAAPAGESAPTPPATEGEAAPAGEASPTGEAPPVFLVALLEIENAEFRYIDRTASPPTDLKLTDLDFHATDLSLDQPVTIELGVALLGATGQNLKVSGELGPVGSPPDTEKLPFDLELELGPLVIDEVKKLGELAQGIPPELSSSDPVFLRATVKGTPRDVAIEGTFSATDAALAYGDVFRKPRGTPFELELAARQSGETVDIGKMNLDLASLKLTSSGQITTGEKGAYDLKIKTADTSLAGWDQLVPAFAGFDVSGTAAVDLAARGRLGAEGLPALDGTVTLAGVNARQSGSPYEVTGLTSTIRLQKDSITVPPTKFALGGSPVEVEATVRELARPRGTFALRSPEIRAASLAVAGEGVQKEETIRDLAVEGNFDLSKAAPTFDGTVRSSAGSVRDVDYQNLDARLALADDVARLEKISLAAFQGTYSGSGRYDMKKPDDPRFDFQSTVQGMELRGLLATQFPGTEKQIEGTLEADLRLAGSGTEWETIQKRLVGDGRVDVLDGVIKDVNLAEGVLSGITGISGLSQLIKPRVREKYPEIFATGDTRFEKLGGTVRIADARATTNDLTIAAQDYTVRGAGEVRFDNTVDFKATLVASQKLTDDLVESVEEIKYVTDEQGRFAVPFVLRGTLPSVKPRPDGEFIARAITRAAVGKGLEKGLEKLLGDRKKGEPTGDQGTDEREPSGEEMLRKGLEGLFGR